MDITYLVLAMKNDYQTGNFLSDYSYANNLEELKEVARNFVAQDWEINFAGKIDILEDYTDSILGDDFVIHHINGDLSDNSIDNLRLVNRRSNEN